MKVTTNIKALKQVSSDESIQAISSQSHHIIRSKTIFEVILGLTTPHELYIDCFDIIIGCKCIKSVPLNVPTLII